MQICMILLLIESKGISTIKTLRENHRKSFKIIQIRLKSCIDSQDVIYELNLHI